MDLILTPNQKIGFVNSFSLKFCPFANKIKANSPLVKGGAGTERGSF